MNKIIYKDIMAFHPGYYIKDILVEYAMDQDELALGLSKVFGTSVSLWLNISNKFNEKKIEIEEKKLWQRRG